jgi:hypothetical protein
MCRVFVCCLLADTRTHFLEEVTSHRQRALFGHRSQMIKFSELLVLYSIPPPFFQTCNLKSFFDARTTVPVGNSSISDSNVHCSALISSFLVRFPRALVVRIRFNLQLVLNLDPKRRILYPLFSPKSLIPYPTSHLDP